MPRPGVPVQGSDRQREAARTALVIQTAYLGDVVLTTPLLELLAERHGPLDVVTTPAAAPLLETHPAVRRVIPYDKHATARGLRSFLGVARRLRAERYEVAYLPHRSLRTAALAWLARIPRRVGFRDGWPLLYTEVRKRSGGHEIDRLRALAEDAAPVRGVTLPARPSLHATIADRAATGAFLHEHGIRDPFVALAPGSIWGSKRWPYYADLARRLAPQAGIVVVGGPEDVALGDQIVRAVEGDGGRWRAANGCARLTLRQSVEVIRHAAVLVTNDSAPLHFAQAGGTPTVAIFGPTVPAFGFGPRGPCDHVVAVAGLPCRPCSAHGPPRCPLGHHRCMTALEVESVLHAIEETGALRRRN